MYVTSERTRDLFEIGAERVGELVVVCATWSARLHSCVLALRKRIGVPASTLALFVIIEAKLKKEHKEYEAEF